MQPELGKRRRRQLPERRQVIVREVEPAKPGRQRLRDLAQTTAAIVTLPRLAQDDVQLGGRHSRDKLGC